MLSEKGMSGKSEDMNALHALATALAFAAPGSSRPLGTAASGAVTGNGRSEPSESCARTLTMQVRSSPRGKLKLGTGSACTSTD